MICVYFQKFNLVCFFRKKEETHRKEIARDPEMAIRLYPGNIHDLIKESSGSGSGVPRIVQQILGVDPYQFVCKLIVEQFWVHPI